MNVRQIPLGKTGLRLSEMVFGGAPIGGLYAPVTGDQAAAALEAARRRSTWQRIYLRKRVGKRGNWLFE